MDSHLGGWLPHGCTVSDPPSRDKWDLYHLLSCEVRGALRLLRPAEHNQSETMLVSEPGLKEIWRLAPSCFLKWNTCPPTSNSDNLETTVLWGSPG